MPTEGQTIANPVTDDSYEFIETAQDTEGERVTMKATLVKTGKVVPNHFHVLQDETFEVVSGRLAIWLNGQTTVLAAGEKITLPKNQPHNHYNYGLEPVIYIQKVTPALDFEYLVEDLMGLAADGKAKNGEYGLVQNLVMMKYLDSKSYLADIPTNIQNFLMYMIAPVARLVGYRAIYKKYSGFEK
jgi:quercetin dioxygenase-like cupin family protein